MFIRVVLIFSIFCSFSCQGMLLDKVMAVIDDKIITLSMVKRISSNLRARKTISPAIYSKTSLSHKEIVEILIHRSLIRSRISDIGYVVNDEQVESQIKSTEKRLRLTRKSLLRFLESNNITFDEYFELIRESIEFNIFNSRIITPLISITEQEIKNTFYKQNISNKTLTFKYTLVDFHLQKSAFKNDMFKRFKSNLTKFQSSGVLPKEYKDLETNVLGDITEDGLTKDLKRLLKRTDEGAFSNPILIGSSWHVFYIKKKDLVESSLYLESKDKIRMILFRKESHKITSLWFQREANKHYTKYFL